MQLTLIEYMQANSGMTHREATLACKSTLAAIAQMLSEGKDCTLQGIGMFKFRVRRERKYRERTIPRKDGKVLHLPAMTLPEIVHVYFKASSGLKAKLKGVKPENVTLPAKIRKPIPQLTTVKISNPQPTAPNA